MFLISLISYVHNSIDLILAVIPIKYFTTRAFILFLLPSDETSSWKQFLAIFFKYIFKRWILNICQKLV